MLIKYIENAKIIVRGSIESTTNVKTIFRVILEPGTLSFAFFTSACTSLKISPMRIATHAKFIMNSES